MQIKKRRLIPLSFLIITLVPLIGILYFILKSKAPISLGKLEYNIEYKTDKTLDIYYPTKSVYKKSPVLLYIHGGAWIFGRKEALNMNRFHHAFNALRDQGYTIISPEYTLAHSGKSPFPNCILDGFDAIDWIVDHADSLNLDLNNFGIMGESAGSHIAMMNAFSHPEDFGRETPKVELDYLINIYGPNDLMDLYHSKVVDSLETLTKNWPNPIKEYVNLPNRLFGFTPDQDPVKLKTFTDKYSPIRYISKETVLPTLIIHGTKDQIVPYSQSVVLKSTLDQFQSGHEFYTLDDVDHIFLGGNQSQKDSIQLWVNRFVNLQYTP